MGYLPRLATFSSKLVLQILPSVSATVIGGYLLAQIHVGQQADPPPQQPQIVVAPTATATPAPDAPTAREERAAMRKVLKQRRENPEAPEVVRPVAPATTASVSPPPAMDSIAPNEPVERAAAPSRAKSAGAVPARREAEHTGTGTDYVPAPPPGLPAASGIAVNTPTAGVPAPTAPPVAVAQPTAPAPIVPPPVIAAQPVAPAPVAPVQTVIPAAPQVATAAAPPPATEAGPPPSRGPVDAVFSTLSSVVGHAANATGNTVNWVIDLPGKAISAGGRIINGPASPPPPPAKLGNGEG